MITATDSKSISISCSKGIANLGVEVDGHKHCQEMGGLLVGVKHIRFGSKIVFHYHVLKEKCECECHE